MPRTPHFLQALARDPEGAWEILAASAAGPSRLASVVELAADSAARRRGLLGRAGLADGAALVIAPCSGVHTFGMQFAIDVIYADRQGRIVKIRREMTPGRMSFAAGAFAAIEMAAGSATRAGVAAGDTLAIAPAPSPTAPRR